jgi:hypothetical protein
MMHFFSTIINNRDKNRVQPPLKNDVLDLKIPEIAISPGIKLIIKNEDAIVCYATDIVSQSDYYSVDVTQWRSGVYELSLYSDLVLMYDTLFFMYRTNILRIFSQTS